MSETTTFRRGCGKRVGVRVDIGVFAVKILGLEKGLAIPMLCPCRLDAHVNVDVRQ
jgi:hypothetical protein